MKKRYITCLFTGVALLALSSCTSSYEEVTSIIPSTEEVSSTITEDKTSIPTSTEIIEKTTTETTTIEETVVEPKEDVELDIISINDLHGYAYEASYNKKYNLASTAYYIDEVREKQEYDNVVLIANGDMFQGTAYSNLSYGLSVVNAMNEMSFDAMGIGNHEFDWGLEKVLNYFDANTTNGEANFPLINGNVNYQRNNQFNGKYNTRVGEANTQDNILPYTIVDKGGVKVGILSYIGPQTNDINQNKLQDFFINCKSLEDKIFYSQVEKDCNTLKSLGADIIIANLHEGSTDGVTEDAMNKYLANIKDEDGNYMIDAILNGHTHSYQEGAIKRTGGMAVPIVQGGCYGNAVGHISLTIDGNNKSVKNINSYQCKDIDDANLFNSKNEAVQTALTQEYEKIKNELKEVYTVTTSYASRDNIGGWTTNIMKKYSNADIALINTGGIRSALSASNITIEELYKINPFDNNLVYVRIKGSELIDFYNANGSNYYFDKDFNISSIDATTDYKLITIDYVYYSYYFTSKFKNTTLDYIDNSLCARDLMKLDMKANGANGMSISKSTTPKLETVGWKSAS